MCKTYVQRICSAKGLKLVDARRPIVVGVGLDDILKSRTANSKCCAFARAAKREPGVLAAYFFRSTAFLEFSNRMVRYRLPAGVQKEIVSFDRAGIMAPGEYELAVPGASRTPEANQAYYKVRKEKATAAAADGLRLRAGDPSKAAVAPGIRGQGQGQGREPARQARAVHSDDGRAVEAVMACANCGGRARVVVVLTDDDGSEWALCRRCVGNDAVTKKGTRT